MAQSVASVAKVHILDEIGDVPITTLVQGGPESWCHLDTSHHAKLSLFQTLLGDDDEDEEDEEGLEAVEEEDEEAEETAAAAAV